jgi:hypothetical protein
VKSAAPPDFQQVTPIWAAAAEILTDELASSILFVETGLAHRLLGRTPQMSQHDQIPTMASSNSADAPSFERRCWPIDASVSALGHKKPATSSAVTQRGDERGRHREAS